MTQLRSKFMLCWDVRETIDTLVTAYYAAADRFTTTIIDSAEPGGVTISIISAPSSARPINALQSSSVRSLLFIIVYIVRSSTRCRFSADAGRAPGARTIVSTMSSFVSMPMAAKRFCRITAARSSDQSCRTLRRRKASGAVTGLGWKKSCSWKLMRLARDPWSCSLPRAIGASRSWTMNRSFGASAATAETVVPALPPTCSSQSSRQSREHTNSASLHPPAVPLPALSSQTSPPYVPVPNLHSPDKPSTYH